MKFTDLSQAGSNNIPPCRLVNLCGLHVLFDCPIDLSALTIFSPLSNKLDECTLVPAEPYYKTVERLHLLNVSLIDVVLISSSMGMLGLPFLTRTKGFSAKIYATEATTRLGQFMMEDIVAMHMEFKQFYGPEKTDFLQLIKWEELETLSPTLKELIIGEELGSWMPLYSAADVKDCLLKVETLKYGEEACYNGTLTITPFSSGLEIGSCNWTLKSPKINISYLSSSVFSSGVAMNFNLNPLQRSDILIYSDFPSSNGANCVGGDSKTAISDLSSTSDNADIQESNVLNSEETEKLNFICSYSIESLKAGGSVLIPIGQLGIILQLLELFPVHLDLSNLKVPIFIVSSVAEELLAYTNIIPEWLCIHRQEKLYSGEPVFGHSELIKEKRIHIFPTCYSHELLMLWKEPCIVFCPHWSLRLGPVVHFLHRWRGDQHSLLVLEEGVDADIALLPFKPIAMKVLECSFLSGIKWHKVPPLLKLLQPKLTLLPDYMRPYFDSPSRVFYNKNETLYLPNLNNLTELHIATDLASQLTWSKSKEEELTFSRLRGEFLVEQGKHYLLPRKHAVSSEMNHWGRLDLESLALTLQKMGVKGFVEKVNSVDGVFHVFHPCKALIEAKETSTVISTADESLASVISDAIHSILDGI